MNADLHKSVSENNGKLVSGEGAAIEDLMMIIILLRWISIKDDGTATTATTRETAGLGDLTDWHTLSWATTHDRTPPVIII